MYIIKNDKLSILNNKLGILNNKPNILHNKLINNSKKPSISNNKPRILVHTIIVQAILVQRYACAPNILYYIKHNMFIPLPVRCHYSYASKLQATKDHAPFR